MDDDSVYASVTKANYSLFTQKVWPLIGAKWRRFAFQTRSCWRVGLPAFRRPTSGQVALNQTAWRLDALPESETHLRVALPRSGH